MGKDPESKATWTLFPGPLGVKEMQPPRLPVVFKVGSTDQRHRHHCYLILTFLQDIIEKEHKYLKSGGRGSSFSP